jgi:hypothetical protein
MSDSRPCRHSRHASPNTATPLLHSTYHLCSHSTRFISLPCNGSSLWKDGRLESFLDLREDKKQISPFQGSTSSSDLCTDRSSAWLPPRRRYWAYLLSEGIGETHKAGADYRPHRVCSFPPTPPSRMPLGHKIQDWQVYLKSWILLEALCPHTYISSLQQERSLQRRCMSVGIFRQRTILLRLS